MNSEIINFEKKYFHVMESRCIKFSLLLVSIITYNTYEK